MRKLENLQDLSLVLTALINYKKLQKKFKIKHKTKHTKVITLLIFNIIKLFVNIYISLKLVKSWKIFLFIKDLILYQMDF